MNFFKDAKGYSPKESEEEVLKFWEKDKTFEKSISKAAPKGEYVFYDGPPFATGLPHYGHILAGTIKDVIPRYRTMQGQRVERKWGWDCHGLPIENIIEGELGLKTKKDIERIGVEKFNEAARNRILSTSDEWEKVVPRVGRWVDMKNDYKTMQPSYMESVLWVFKSLYDKGLIYEGHKVMQICPRCETSLSNFEVSQGYKDITDISVVIKARLKGEDASVLAWTTTPWTLPGNVALAINPKFEYVLIEVKDETGKTEKFILAKTRLEMVKQEYKILKSIKGEELVGKSYEPFFDYFKNAELKNKENAWKIYPANFVTDKDGTGVVHIAPAFGEDDMKVAHAHHLPIIQHVKMSGEIIPEVKDFAGLQAKPKANEQSTDIEVIKWLAHNGKLFSKEKITHSYPHCWRCDTPLLNYATSSWFVKVTDIKHGKNGLVENNKKIHWVPEGVGKNRFGNWLKDARDWAISRSRYWGAPIPVWRCDDCKKIKIVGSAQEIKDSIAKSGNSYFVMRHGQAESNTKNIVSSSVSNSHHLTTKGKKEVSATAKKLIRQLANKKIDLIISSDFLRTKETAELVAKELKIPSSQIIFDKRIREINCGDFNLKSVKEYNNYFTSLEEKFTKRTPNGEDLTELKNRMGEFIHNIDKKYQNKNILIVSHEYPIWNLFAASIGADAKEAIKLRNKKEDFIKTGELKKLDFVPIPHNRNYEFDLHRPYIDEVEFECDCGGKMQRVKDVFDCWFESGSMPYGQAHYPFENKNKFERNFPAEFIAEGLDQTRGWFYTLLVLSTGIFKKAAYKNVIVNGLILAEDGQKMSKKLKNYPDPMYLIDRYGADALRLYLMTSPVVRAEDLNFSEKGVDEVYKKTVLRFFNVYSFYKLYVNKTAKISKPSSKNILDKWILARLNEVISDVTLNLDKYELDRAARPLYEFVDDLSTWYLRRSRRRLQKPETKSEFNEAANTLGYVISEFSKVLAPFAPFVSDAVFMSLTNSNKSVHLVTWPKADKKLINKKLLAEMKESRILASDGLALRSKLGIKVRQPLAKLEVKNAKSILKGKYDLLAIVKDEVNVKDVIFGTKISEAIELDKNITPELYKEGIIREFIRAIQDLRQKAGYQPQNKINLYIEAKGEIAEILNEKLNEIKKEVNAKTIENKKVSKVDFQSEINLDIHKIWAGVNKN